MPIYPPYLQVALGVDLDLSDVPHSVEYRLEQPLIIAGDKHEWLGVQHYCYDPSMAPREKSIVKASFLTDYDYWKNLRDYDKRYYEEEKKGVADAVVSFETPRALPLSMAEDLGHAPGLGRTPLRVHMPGGFAFNCFGRCRWGTVRVENDRRTRARPFRVRGAASGDMCGGVRLGAPLSRLALASTFAARGEGGNASGVLELAAAMVHDWFGQSLVGQGLTSSMKFLDLVRS